MGRAGRAPSSTAVRGLCLFYARWVSARHRSYAHYRARPARRGNAGPGVQPPAAPAGSAAHVLDAPPVLEIDAVLAPHTRKDPTPDRAAEERGGLIQHRKSILADLGAVDHDPSQLLI